MNIEKQGIIDDSCSGTCPRFNDNDNIYVVNETDSKQSEIDNKINNNNNTNNNNNNTTAIETSSANVSSNPASISIELSGNDTVDDRIKEQCDQIQSNTPTAIVDDLNVNKSDTVQMARTSTDTKPTAIDAAANATSNDTTTAATAAITVTAIEPEKDSLNVAGNNVVETICDEVTTAEDIKKLKHVQGRSNSTGKLYQSSRRVSFPENDSELVTGYLEPADPWASG